MWRMRARKRHVPDMRHMILSQWEEAVHAQKYVFECSHGSYNRRIGFYVLCVCAKEKMEHSMDETENMDHCIDESAICMYLRCLCTSTREYTALDMITYCVESMAVLEQYPMVELGLIRYELSFRLYTSMQELMNRCSMSTWTKRDMEEFRYDEISDKKRGEESDDDDDMDGIMDNV
jgi:hypothetical protein